MDISPQATTQPMSDDQELAKALAGVVNDPEPAATPTKMQHRHPTLRLMPASLNQLLRRQHPLRRLQALTLIPSKRMPWANFVR
jgi:hypothetical protein